MDVKAILLCSEEPAGGSVLSLMNEIYKIGKLYSLEYADIVKVFFIPHITQVTGAVFLSGVSVEQKSVEQCP
jgi:hypothetical protein